MIKANHTTPRSIIANTTSQFDITDKDDESIYSLFYQTQYKKQNALTLIQQ